MGYIRWRLKAPGPLSLCLYWYRDRWCHTITPSVSERTCATVFGWDFETEAFFSQSSNSLRLTRRCPLSVRVTCPVYRGPSSKAMMKGRLKPERRAASSVVNHSLVFVGTMPLMHSTLKHQPKQPTVFTACTGSPQANRALYQRARGKLTPLTDKPNPSSPVTARARR